MSTRGKMKIKVDYFTNGDGTVSVKTGWKALTNVELLQAINGLIIDAEVTSNLTFDEVIQQVKTLRFGEGNIDQLAAVQVKQEDAVEVETRTGWPYSE